MSTTERPAYEVVKVQHHFAQGVYAKEQHIPGGSEVRTHSHAFDHLSILASGRAVLHIDGTSRELSAGECVLVEAHKKHRITALTDCIWYCIWPTDEKDPSKIDSIVIERK